MLTFGEIISERMRYLLTLLTLALMASPFAYTQSDPDHHHDHSDGTHERCGTMHNFEALKADDPGLEERMQQIEEMTNAWLINNAHKLKNTNDVVTIPVVVHVVYANASQNVSDAQILSQIEVLNQDYRRMNADAGNTPAVFQSLAADIEVEFCLATRDPNGNATSGITRKQTTNTNFNTTNNSVKFAAAGGTNAWDANSYMNMWVCKLQGGVLGYAQFPGGSAATDGVVIDYQSFGTMGTATYPFNKGRTATHEVGHWLNLRHIWGDDGGACTGTDYVNDTPNQGAEYYNCPSYPKSSCSSEDMFMNYMDYVNDNCMNLFTAGQKARMLAAINIWRSGLLSSLGCISEPPAAQLAVDANFTVPGCAVNFTDQSTGVVQTYQWTFENGNPSSSTAPNPGPVAFSQVGQWDVTLIVGNPAGNDTLFLDNFITVSDTLRPQPAFELTRRIVCTGEQIRFTDQSTACPTGWMYSFDPPTVSFHGGTWAGNADPLVSFDAPGKYTVTLEVTNVNGARSIKHQDLILAGGAPVWFMEFFEDGGLERQEWERQNPDADFSWELATVPSDLPDNKAVVIPIHGTNSLSHRDRLITPAVNLSGLTQAYLMFKHAYAQYEAALSDSLIIYVSADCGQTWARVFSGGDNGTGNFATRPPMTQKFTPAGDAEWCGGSYGSPCNGIDLSAWAGQPNVRIAFEAVSTLGNNIYLDDIRITNVLAAGEALQDEPQLSVFPNPSDGHVTLGWKNLSGKFHLRLNNLQGKTVYSIDIQLTEGNYLSLDVSALPAGMYLMDLVGDSQVVSRKLILR